MYFDVVAFMLDVLEQFSQSNKNECSDNVYSSFLVASQLMSQSCGTTRTV